MIKTLQWVANIWQRYNECLQKLSLPDASLGPALFFDCPMEREAIFEYVFVVVVSKMTRKTNAREIYFILLFIDGYK